jgi:hypothetical protein
MFLVSLRNTKLATHEQVVQKNGSAIVTNSDE